MSGMDPRGGHYHRRRRREETKPAYRNATIIIPLDLSRLGCREFLWSKSGLDAMCTIAFSDHGNQRRIPEI